MHIPDGYLTPVTSFGFWGVMLPVWAVASKVVTRSLSSARVPHLAMAASFSLIVMIIAVPLPGGTTGHLSGTALVAILLGPWTAVLTVSVALGIQALLFGEGGFLALGANCFAIAAISAFTASAVYHAFNWLLGYLSTTVIARRSPRRPTKQSQESRYEVVSGALAAYAAINVSALATALVLGFQPRLGAGFFPYPLSVTVPVVAGIHLTVIGSLEAVMTGLILKAVRARREFSSIFKKSALGAAAGCMLLGGSLTAHEYWIEPDERNCVLVFGHGEDRLKFDAGSILWTAAWAPGGEDLVVSRGIQHRSVVIGDAEGAAVVAAEVDGGYWSKTIYGWKNLPKSRARRVVESHRARHFAKMIVQWASVAGRPLAGVELDLTPTVNPFSLSKGGRLSLVVHWNGRPLSGARVERSNHESVGITDEKGVVHVRLNSGFQVYTVNHRVPRIDDPDADHTNLSATLSFEVK